MKKLGSLVRVGAATFASALLLCSAAACELDRIPQGECHIDDDYVFDCTPEPGLTDR